MRRTSLVMRVVMLTSGVAIVAVVIAVLVSYPLVRSAAQSQAQATLARLADLTASALERGVNRPGEPLPRRLAEALIAEQVTAYLVPAVGQLPPGVTEEQGVILRSGGSISSQATTDVGFVFIEGRGLGNGISVVLEQPGAVTGGPVAQVLVRLAIALFVGLVIAIAIGFLVARRITRPLRSAATAAHALAAGSRDVVVPVAGPSEVAEIGEAINTLSASLTASEQRQRDFLLSVSHELRTPLTAVKGYGEALADGVVPEADVSRTGDIVVSEAARLDRLVSDLLDLARLGAVDFAIDLVDVDADDVGSEAAQVWRDRCAREGVEFRYEGTSLPLRTDPVRLRQIIDNLTENALRVTPSGAPIVLHVGRGIGEDEGMAVIEVRDGGPGLTAEDLAVAFEPSVLYERYRGVRKVGTGFGLALVGRLATSLGGRAEAGVAGEGGARFTVLLPLLSSPGVVE